MHAINKTTSYEYQRPKVLESFEELEVLGDAPGIAVGGTGSGITRNEV